MKAPHLLRVEDPPEAFAPLAAALAEAGLRFGWLELAPPPEPPARLEAAASLGALRAVAAGAGRTLAAKPVTGEPVLRDLVREHFLGCRLLLVRGAADAPLLTPDGDAWRLTRPGDAPERLTTLELLARLRRPSRGW